MSQSTRQVKLNFDRMTESGLKPLTKKLEGHGLKITDIKATNRPKRESGFLTKAAMFEFDTGQKLMVRVKADGTVFQVKLNNRVIPIRHVDDMGKAVKEIVDAVQDNARAFVKARERRLAKKKLQIDKPAPIRTTRKEKIEQQEAALKELQSEADGIQERISATTTTLSEKTGRVEELQAELQTLQERGTTLEQQLKEMTEAA
jgi:uncharacterized protein (DUF3084 family)